MPEQMMKLPRRLLRRAFRPIFSAVSTRHFRWLSRHREHLTRQLLFDTIVGFVADAKVEGDYLEFGCAQGGSLTQINRSSRAYRNLDSMRYYIFDSFEGLPEPKGLDAGEVIVYKKGEYACDIDRYKSIVRKRGVDLGRVKCIPGWYDKTLNDPLKRELPIKKASIVLIDCDLYESTVPVLDFITDYLQDGTVLIFDDWYSYKGRVDLGEARAFKEWLARNPTIRAEEYHKAGRTMMSFIMQVNCGTAVPVPVPS